MKENHSLDCSGEELRSSSFWKGFLATATVAFEAAGCSVEAYWPLLMARKPRNMGQFGDRINGVACYLAVSYGIILGF